MTHGDVEVAADNNFSATGDLLDLVKELVNLLPVGFSLLRCVDAETAGRPYFELEYVEGSSLDRRLDGTPWPSRRAAKLIEALARGVVSAHRVDIVHRDPKPGNVLLAADGKPGGRNAAYWDLHPRVKRYLRQTPTNAHCLVSPDSPMGLMK